MYKLFTDTGNCTGFERERRPINQKNMVPSVTENTTEKEESNFKMVKRLEVNAIQSLLRNINKGSMTVQ